MKRIAMVGYFGWGNFGDELFLEAHKQHLGRDYELVVANDLLAAPYFSKPVAKLVEDFDGVLIGGGDLLNPLRVSDLYWDVAWLNKPTFIYGLGVPRASFRRENVIAQYKKFVQHENCKLIVARDVESYEWIRENLEPGDKLKWYPDPVCALDRPAATPPKEKTLGVVMREHRSLDQDMSHVRKLIDEAKAMDYKIKHLVLATKSLGEGDLKRAQIIAKDDEQIVHSESLSELCAAISSVSALATIKFHGLVVATMYGVPSVAMSVTPKNRNFLRMIERPEMLVSYTDPNLYKHLSHYPARIHQRVRGGLYREAREGYRVLKETIAQHI
ncbi:polysaccharide pyruvyl transferase family protein [Glutamicibacter sp. V16R2B1]|uniref:polysaccharide pyruvyl transferase family protein n=1 Tax=Glutamicibacter sp. V16R2B1 TaxID=2036207 RepID=UPI0014854896|nr:polysaccharide pyruvyl transferase family protein [Glutamicibacter sp. V16R2B1]